MKTQNKHTGRVNWILARWRGAFAILAKTGSEDARPTLRASRRSIAMATRILAAAILLSFSLLDAPAWAQSMTYTAPAECPSRHEFMTAIRVRIAELERTELDSTKAVALEIIATRDGYVGTLEMKLDGRTILSRQLEDRQCIALVEGFALVTAMALSPGAPMPESRSPAPRVVAAPQKTEAKTELANAGASPSDASFEVAIAAVGGLATAPAPDPLLSGGVHLALHHRSRALSLGVSLQYGESEWRHFQSGDARFRWATSRLLGCPLGLRHRVLTLMACGLVEVGGLRGEPQHTRQAKASNAWWIAPGLGGQVGFGYRGMMLEFFGGAVRPLIRDEFYFARVKAGDGHETVHRPPAIGLAAEMSVGLTF